MIVELFDVNAAATGEVHANAVPALTAASETAKQRIKFKTKRLSSTGILKACATDKSVP